MHVTSGKNAKPLACPFCQRTLVSRLVDFCQYCEKPLPLELCLSDEEKEELKRQERAARDKERRKRPIRPRGLSQPVDPWDGVDLIDDLFD